MAGAWGPEDLVDNAFRIEEYSAGSVVKEGPLSFSFQEVPHFTQTFAIRVQGDGGSLVYGADSSPNDDLVEFAADCDLLLVEATLPRPERTGIRGHMTPAEAGEHARHAGAKKVVLTHISDELGDEWARTEAEKAFKGPVDVAREGAVYEL